MIFWQKNETAFCSFPENLPEAKMTNNKKFFVADFEDSVILTLCKVISNHSYVGLQ